MKKLYVFIFIICFVSLSKAQDRGFGLGVVLGEPTAISAKYWTSLNTAVDFALGYKVIGSNKGISFHTDYLFHNYTLHGKNLQLPIYYGVGLRLRAADDRRSSFGVRGVVGIEYYSYRNRLDFFFELAPVFTLLPGTDLDFDAGIGLRYFFD